MFVSPAQRAAETVAWLLRGLGEQLPAHAVVPGLAAKDNDGSPLAMAGVVAALLDAVPEGERGLAISHTPLIERAVLGSPRPRSSRSPNARASCCPRPDDDDRSRSASFGSGSRRGPLDSARGVRPRRRPRGVARTGAAPAVLRGVARRGRGLRAMAGANATFGAMMLLLAAGLSSLEPGETFLRVVRVIGGAFLVFLAVDAPREPSPQVVDEPRRRYAPQRSRIVASC